MKKELCQTPSVAAVAVAVAAAAAAAAAATTAGFPGSRLIARDHHLIFPHRRSVDLLKAW